MNWSELGDWWLSEIVEDPAYETVVTPMLLDIMRPAPGKTYLDLGSGEGRVMRALSGLGVKAHGVDLSLQLASLSSSPTVIGELPRLGFLADDSYDGAYCVLALEHIPDHVAFFTETARVVRPCGTLSLVMNHPMWTAPEATAITDVDGEVYWRPGTYFGRGTVEEPAGPGKVVFHHRTLYELLTSAAEAGWSLVRMVEAPHHEFEDQVGIPRMLAVCWTLAP